MAGVRAVIAATQHEEMLGYLEAERQAAALVGDTLKEAQACPLDEAEKALAEVETEHDRDDAAHRAAKDRVERATEARAALTAAIMAARAAGETAAQVRRAVMRHYRPYAEVVADRIHHDEVASLMAAKRWLVGLEGAAPLPREGGVVADAAFDQIPDPDKAAIGAEAWRLAVVSELAAKNSVRPRA
jgi:hypothetical protein